MRMSTPMNSSSLGPSHTTMPSASSAPATGPNSSSIPRVQWTPEMIMVIADAVMEGYEGRSITIKVQLHVSVTDPGVTVAKNSVDQYTRRFKHWAKNLALLEHKVRLTGARVDAGPDERAHWTKSQHEAVQAFTEGTREHFKHLQFSIQQILRVVEVGKHLNSSTKDKRGKESSSKTSAKGIDNSMDADGFRIKTTLHSNSAGSKNSNNLLCSDSIASRSTKKHKSDETDTATSTKTDQLGQTHAISEMIAKVTGSFQSTMMMYLERQDAIRREEREEREAREKKEREEREAREMKEREERDARELRQFQMLSMLLKGKIHEPTL